MCGKCQNISSLCSSFAACIRRCSGSCASAALGNPLRRLIPTTSSCEVHSLFKTIDIVLASYPHRSSQSILHLTLRVLCIWTASLDSPLHISNSHVKLPSLSPQKEPSEFRNSLKFAPCLCGCSAIAYTLTHPHQTHSTMAGKRRRNSNGEDETVHDTTHPSRKRRVEFGVVDAKLATLYNDLSEDVKATRLRAAADLIRTLADADQEALDKSLTRLIRGLCSSRKSARSGFSVALIEILKLTSKSPATSVEGVDLTLPAIIDKIVSITQPEETSNNKVRHGHVVRTSHIADRFCRKEEIILQVVALVSSLSSRVNFSLQRVFL